MYREMLQIPKFKYRKHVGLSLSSATPEDRIESEARTIKQRWFSFHVEHYGMEYRKRTITHSIQSAFNRMLSDRGRTKLNAIVGKDVRYQKSSLHRGVHNFVVPLAWYRTVWLELYGKNVNLVGDRIVVEAVKVRKPHRGFDFYNVKYVEAGKWVLAKGQAAKSRRFPKCITVQPLGVDIFAKADEALARYVAGELHG